jgi:hypothetical protein
MDSLSPSTPFPIRATNYVHANPLSQGCTNLERQVTRPTTFCTLASNICQSSVWNVLHVTFLVPRILRWLLDFWKRCGTLRLTNDFISANIWRNVQILQRNECYLKMSLKYLWSKRSISWISMNVPLLWNKNLKCKHLNAERNKIQLTVALQDRAVLLAICARLRRAWNPTRGMEDDTFFIMTDHPVHC